MNTHLLLYCDKRVVVLAKFHQSRRKKKFITLFSQHNPENLLMHNYSTWEARLVATCKGSKRPFYAQEHWMTWHVTLHDYQHAQKKQVIDTSKHNTEYGRHHRLAVYSTNSREVFYPMTETLKLAIKHAGCLNLTRLSPYSETHYTDIVSTFRTYLQF